LILRRDERSPREKLGHDDGDGIVLMIYTASKNPNFTHHRSRPLTNNMSFTHVDESHMLT